MVRPVKEAKVINVPIKPKSRTFLMLLKNF